MLTEFIRHRVTVIRRRTQFLLARARRRKHTVEGLLLALANIDEIIRIIRNSETQAAGQGRADGRRVPGVDDGPRLGRAQGFEQFQLERGVADVYMLTAVQAEAILKMTLGQLVNLEQERLSGEHRNCWRRSRVPAHLVGRPEHHGDHPGGSAGDPPQVRRRPAHRDHRRRTGQYRPGGPDHRRDDGRLDQPRGYIKRTPASVYRAQRRGGKGLRGAQVEDEDPIQHLFVASTHAYLLFFTNQGKVYWQKVYDLPQLGRESKGGRSSTVAVWPRARRSPIAGRCAISICRAIS
jgi:DNA gyrase subunit A